MTTRSRATASMRERMAAAICSRSRSEARVTAFWLPGGGVRPRGGQPPGPEEPPHPADPGDAQGDQQPLPGADQPPPARDPVGGGHALADRAAEGAADAGGLGPGSGPYRARPWVGQAIADRVGEHGE